MAKDVKIPVRVEGADKAQADLKKTGQAVSGVGDAGKKSAAGTRAATTATQQHAAAQKKAGKATKKSAEAIDTFDDKGRTAARGMVAFMNPAMASVVTMVNDVARGFSRITVGLLGFIGVGIALAGVTKFFQHMAEAARKAEEAVKRQLEALKKLREEALSFQQKMAEAMKAAGQLGVAGPGGRYAQRLMEEQGMPAGLAMFGAVARQVGGLTGAQVRQVLGGYVLGGEQAKFGLDQAENRRIVGELLAAGAEPRGEQALRARIADVAEQARRETPSERGFRMREQRIDTLIEELRKSGAFTDRTIEVIERLALEGVKAGRPVDMEMAEKIPRGWWSRAFGRWAASARRFDRAVGEFFGRTAPKPFGPFGAEWWEGTREKEVRGILMPDTGLNLGQLIDMAERIRFQAVGAERWENWPAGIPGALREGQPVPTTQPVIINVNQQTTNVGTQYNEVGMRPDAWSLEPALLGREPGAP